ncbi:neur_chan_LBD domain-containing protein [Caerostris extrusa]|uniref:Neur_chan_LBD domain-containing protein n=1 Tax=Caerostris extrusa TaxID=172846 RepID=A0AAV4WWP0_CAEEX|nr:neur_chan_LBD domain-containing protein [Caerostris extrusa]
MGIQTTLHESMVDKLCNNLLPEGYEIYKAPDEDGKPITVLVGFQVLDIGEVDEEKNVRKIATKEVVISMELIAIMVIFRLFSQYSCILRLNQRRATTSEKLMICNTSCPCSSAQDFRLHAFVTSMWNDSRLLLDKYSKNEESEFIIVYERCRRYFWTPDVFFENAKHIENYENTSPSTLLKVLPDGAIIMSTR